MQEEKQKRKELNEIARANGVPLPFPEEDWSLDDEKLIKAAVKKFTSNYKSLPRGYDREDMLQEARQKWAAVKDKHDSSKTKKSTYCYRVVQNQIRDLVRAGNYDKRRIEQNTLEYNEEVTNKAIARMAGWTKKPDPRGRIDIDYNGDENAKVNPARRGMDQMERWGYEQEPEK